MRYEEKIDMQKAQFLLNLNDDTFYNDIFSKDEKDQDGNIYTKEQYLKNIKKWLELVIAKKGLSNTEYKYSAIMKNKGRQYVKKFGIQSLQSDLRGFLCEDNYLDFDIINCAPSTLNYLVKKLFPKQDFKFLDYYVRNREKFLKENDTDKHKVLVMLNNHNTYTQTKPQLKGLNENFSKIRDLFWDTPINEYDDISRVGKEGKNNQKGSYLNRILCVEENNILSKVVKQNSNVAVLMFDGFLQYKTEEQEPIQNTINKLNEITNEYNIKWSNKLHKHNIKYDPNLEPPIYEEDPLSHEIVKKQFEENNFMTENPLQFYSVFDKEVVSYSKEHFSLLHKPIKAKELVMGSLHIVEFMPYWISDPNRRVYRGLTFVPSLEYNNPNYFNTFLGFDNDKIIEEESWDMDALKLFRSHVALLCDYNKEYTNYLENWLSHLFQFPNENPETAVVICGNKGNGKDLFYKYINAILGEKYTFETSKFEEVFGNFNSGLKNKIVAKLGEVSGANGIKFKEAIKETMTAKVITINEKSKQPYEQPNYIRWLLFSNNDNPVEITADNRRFWVLRSGEKKDFQYYKKLFNNMKDRNILHTIYNYYYKRNIDDFNVRDFPITEKMKIMTDNCISPIYEYLYNTFNQSITEIEGLYIKEDNNKLYVRTTDFYTHYEEYLSDESITHNHLNHKNFKKLLVNIQGSPIKYSNTTKLNNDGKGCKCYIINKNNLIIHLDKLYKFSEIVME